MHMNSNPSKKSITTNVDDELDYAIAEAIDHFAHCNIRFRTPNRNIGPAHQHKYFKPAREPESH